MTPGDTTGVAADAATGTGIDPSTGPIPVWTTVASLASFLVFFGLLQTEALWRSLVVADLDVGGWDPVFQLISVLVPLAAIPLVLAPLRAPGHASRTARGLLSGGLLVLYALSLWVVEATGLAGYMVVMALASVGVVLADRRADAGAAGPPADGTLLAGWGPGVLVAGLAMYALAVVGVIAIVPLALGLVLLLVGTPWAAASRGLAREPVARQAVVSGLIAGLATMLFATAWIAWCFAAPLVYLVAPPALLALAVGLWPPWRTGPGRVSSSGRWQGPRWWAVALAGVIVLLLAARVAGLGLSVLCG